MDSPWFQAHFRSYKSKIKHLTMVVLFCLSVLSILVELSTPFEHSNPTSALAFFLLRYFFC